MIAPAIFITALLLTFAAPLLAVLCLGLSVFVVSTPQVVEKLCFRMVRFFFFFSLLASFMALICWVLAGCGQGTIDLARFSLSSEYSINIRLFYDIFGLIFLFTSTLIINLIVFYSQRYLHRDPQYRRFFMR